MSKDLVPVGDNLPEPLEFVEGEYIDGLYECDRCGERHSVISGVVRCCCGDEHDVEFCCDCGHFHQGTLHPEGPCGNYRCCIN